MNIQEKIFDLIEKEKIRQLGGLELIASENFTSDDVMRATGSILTNKYAEGYPGKRYYGGCEVVDQIELVAIGRLKELFNVEYANVQPHSGSQANTAVFDAFLKPGDKIVLPATGYSKFVHMDQEYYIINEKQVSYKQSCKRLLK